MIEENKQPTNQEIDNKIKELVELKKTLQPQSSYDARPVKQKLLYDLQPMKLLSHFIKTAIILLIIGAGIFGYGYWKGHSGKPVNLVISEEVEFTIPVPNSPLALHKAKHSTELQWINIETGKVIATVKVKDIPELAKKLKPYGFQFKPFVTAGGSLGESKAGFEAGAGIDFFKWFRYNANAFITNLGAYLGLGYQITDNFDIMLGVGKGWKGDNRVGLFGKFKF
jgi:hypothetical protein